MNNTSFTPVQFKTINEHQLNQRLDNFLMAECRTLPKNRIYQMIRKGEVRVNKGRSSPTYRLQIGDEVRIPPLKRKVPPTLREPTEKELGNLKALILKETEDIIVINKPSGLPVHRGSGVDLGLIELLKAYNKTTFLALAHRLDRETSGLVLMAKNRPILLALQALFAQTSIPSNPCTNTKAKPDTKANIGSIKKEYLLVVKGEPQQRSFTVTLPLDTKHRNQNGERMVIVSKKGAPSATHFEVKRVFINKTIGKFSLLKAQLFTGRTHQIRVHSAAIGHPVLGDSRYGDSLLEESSKNNKRMGINRLFLHASLLKFTLNQQNYLLTAPLPQDISQWLETMTRNNS